jgi:hypothetical protein
MADDELIDPDDADIESAVADLESPDAPAADAGASDFSEGYDDAADEVAFEEAGQPRGPDGKFLPKAEAAAPVAADPNAAPAVPESVVDPFAGYNPFAFKIDGTDVALEGIRANETHVVIPRDVWDQQLRPTYLANRESWQQERGSWKQREHGYQQQIQHAQQRSDAIVSEFNALIADPDRLQAFVQDYERQLPILQAQMRADAAERQLWSQHQEQQRQQQEAEYQQVFAAGTDAFEAEAVALLKDPMFASIAPTSDDERDELLADIWQTMGPQLVLVGDGNRVSIDKDTLTQQLTKRAQFVARREQKWKSATTTEQRNAAAIASPATSPQTAPIPKGSKPSTAPKRPMAPKAPGADVHRITDEDRETWRNDFASAFDD